MPTDGTPAPAPWRSSFLDHLTNHMDSPEFVLSTLHPAPEGSVTPYVPHARFCIFRGMWTQLPENKHNDAPRNPQIYESDCMTFTSDKRMEKVSELFRSSKGNPGADGRTKDGEAKKDDQQDRGSGGGGPVEAVWWVKDKNVQWRVKGEAFIVGPDMEGDGAGASGVRTVKREIGQRMRCTDESKKEEWSWIREITGHFGNNSPGLRGSFKQPPPGQPKDQPYNDKDEKMGEKVTDLNDPVARENFRVVIIKPEEVEMLDLNPETMHRDKYSYDASADTWNHTETWP